MLSRFKRLPHAKHHAEKAYSLRADNLGSDADATKKAKIKLDGITSQLNSLVLDVSKKNERTPG